MKKKLPLAAYWAAWWSVTGIGWQTFGELLKIAQHHRVGLDELWQRSELVMAAKLLTSQQLQSWLLLRQQTSLSELYQEWQARGITLVCKDTPEYPPLLTHSTQPPWLLFVQGTRDLAAYLGELPLAVVGTRHMTAYGEQATKVLTTQLVTAGATSIVSGAMYGVDTCAHLAALGAGAHTVGVLGFGFDHCYPRSHQGVLKQILTKGGVLVSEYPPATTPRAGLFHVRNRLVAGMVKGVLVTEAAERSGSHSTAQWAADASRSVYAVPGSIFSPYSAGTRALVNQGAMLVAHGSEVIADLGLELSPQSSTAQQPIDGVLGQLTVGPATAEQLSRHLGISYTQLQLQLTSLELSNQVRQQAGQWYLNG